MLGGIYLAEFGGVTVPFVVRYTADLLNGVPSIVIGIFAYAIVVMPVHHFSTLAGGFALGTSSLVGECIEPLMGYDAVVTQHALDVSRFLLNQASLLLVATVMPPALSHPASPVTGVLLVKNGGRLAEEGRTLTN